MPSAPAATTTERADELVGVERTRTPRRSSASARTGAISCTSTPSSAATVDERRMRAVGEGDPALALEHCGLVRVEPKRPAGAHLVRAQRLEGNTACRECAGGLRGDRADVERARPFDQDLAALLLELAPGLRGSARQADEALVRVVEPEDPEVPWLEPCTCPSSKRSSRTTVANGPCKRSRGSRADDPTADDDDVGVAAHGGRSYEGAPSQRAVRERAARAAARESAWYARATSAPLPFSSAASTARTACETDGVDRLAAVSELGLRDADSPRQLPHHLQRRDPLAALDPRDVRGAAARERKSR